MNEYEVSVVIPIYNCEKYIRSCVKSILNQDYEDLSKIQIILVNDGSTDNSLEKCYGIQKDYSNLHIEVIAGENEGVSAARNKGIKASKGKYIMFIDADDFISKNAIRKLKKFFDEHYDEVDLITYPIYYYDQSSKEKKKLNRYDKFYEGTNIYDLTGKDYYLIQPNMNIIVKNRFKNNILFDTKIKFHEDEKYNVDNLIRKKKIGYVEKAKYIYRRHEDGTTEIKSNPYYCFEDYISLYEYYIERYCQDDGYLPKFIQAYVINDFRWRLLQDRLFPYHYEKEKFNNSINRIRNILKYINNKNIVNDLYMDRYHKIYLLKLKENKFDIHTNHKGLYSINANNDILDVINGIEIVINRFKVKDEKIKILAYLKSPILYFKKPELYIRYVDNNKKINIEKINLKNSTANFYKTNVEVAKFYMFTYEINMKNVKKFEFETNINDENIKINYYFNKYSSIMPKINSNKVYSGIYRVQFKKNQFLITKPKKETVKKDKIRAFKRYLKINPKINFFRYFASTNKKIWIYNDRMGVFDNSYLQFKHDVNIKDGIERYYALDGDINKYKNKFDKRELRNVVKFGSLKHKILFLRSDKIITSFSNIQEWCPLCNNYNYYKDILKYDLIYLQHGVLHATCIKIYSKEFTPLDQILISSEFEKNNFIKKYNYSSSDLICCGMPRLDIGSRENCEPENKIIFAPSWRNYLVGKMINRKRKVNEKKFKESKYYIETVKFLKNDELIKILRKNNTIIDLKLHPIFEPYKECFNEIINDNVTVSIGETDLSKYKAFITDFSSFQFDFVNLKRPIIYFVPDMDEFKSGLHLYRELDLKHEDAFGKLCLTGDDLVNEVIKLIDNNFEMEPLYKERMENFFFKVDNRKDKLYEVLKNN